jgi:membrane fusion protein (multidrug efflux system)
MTAVLGAPVDANQPVVEVADPSALDVVFNLSVSGASQVHPGQTVSLLSDGGAGSGSREALGSGVVTAVGLAIDTASRSVTARSSLSHPSRTVRIGETVFGRIAVGVHQKAVVIPSQALVPVGENFKVFVVDSAGVAHSRPVKVGSRTEDRAEIVEGLTGGETIVTYGAYSIEDSARIALPKP